MIFYIKFVNGVRLFAFIFLSGITCLLNVSCSKLVEIDPPSNTIITSEAFRDSATANSAVLGIYIPSSTNSGNLDLSSMRFNCGLTTIYCGLSSDELLFLRGTGDPNTNSIYSNSIVFDNPLLPNFWYQLYSTIYRANACIEGLTLSKELSSRIKDRLIGEAKFLRAFHYFYLLNLYGEVPLVVSTDWRNNAAIGRSSIEDVYQLIINDLTIAKESLPDNYSYSANERVRANRWAAKALLARVYLYLEKWTEAETEATAIINNSNLYSLNSNLDNVFDKNNSEAILQWHQNVGFAPFNANAEGLALLPYPGELPNWILSPILLNAFEQGDNRKIKWIKAHTSGANTYLLPYKYKIGQGQNNTPNTPASQYYTILRLAEQYLIRAEARIMQGRVSEGVSDINIIRTRARGSNLGDLPNLSNSLSQQDAIMAVEQERRIELFAEWGHRWFDLKRTKRVDAIMSIVTPQKGGANWNSFQKKYPLPPGEILLNPNLSQNSGY